MLVLKFPSPPYEAVIEWLPTDSELVVVNVAWPELSVPVPSVVLPSLNVTVPVGVPVPGAAALTVAVKVTDSPETELPDGLTDVVVSALLTVWVSVDEMLVLKFPSPPYVAVMVWSPTDDK